MLTETDIANLALQRCGASRIEPNELWSENTKQAAEVRSCYHAMRQAELRRNVWRFSIRTTILRALDDGNTKKLTFANWSSSASYEINDIVRDSEGTVWIAIDDMSVGEANPKDKDFTKWERYYGPVTAMEYDDETVYMAGEIVYEGATYYFSVSNNNEDNLPSTDDGTNWKSFSSQPSGRLLAFNYPAGAGPASNTQTKNVFMLPAGFMREAPQNPNQGNYMPLGAPAYAADTDWLFENRYFTSVATGPIPFRFAADIEDPTLFDPMFVNGFSCTIAQLVVEPLTQSTSKKAGIGGDYLKFMTEARLVNGIETGSIAPVEDTYITSRY